MVEIRSEFLWTYGRHFRLFCLRPYTSKTYVSESNKDRINCFITFRDQLSYFGKKGKIILCGNFNARTGNLDDFAEDVS